MHFTINFFFFKKSNRYLSWFLMPSSKELKKNLLPFVCPLSASAWLFYLKMIMGWCCLWVRSHRGSLSAHVPLDWILWRGLMYWCRWIRAVCWPLSTWGCARTREMTHIHTQNTNPLFYLRPQSIISIFVPMKWFVFEYCLWLVVLSSFPYHPSFSYKVTSTVASVWDNIKRVFSR